MPTRQNTGEWTVGISIISHGWIGKSNEAGVTERNLTASCHELAIGYHDSTIRILNDIGGYQGTGTLERNIEDIASGTNCIVLTHPHMDHIGDLPRLFTGGKTYAGRIIATPGTKRATEVALKDAAKIQMEFYTRAMEKFEEARKDIRKLIHTIESYEKRTPEKTRSGNNLRKSNEPTRLNRRDTAIELLDTKYGILQKNPNGTVEVPSNWEELIAPPPPTFVLEDVERAVAHIETQNISDGWQDIVPWKVRLRYYNAGHIIGSAMALYEIIDENGKPHKVLFSGDIGSYKWDLHINGIPTPPNNDPIDAVVIESTYGWRVRDKFEEGRTEWEDSLVNAFESTKERKPYNQVIHACFSLDRLQNMLFRVVSLKKAGKLNVPIYVDSPMGIAYIQAYITEARRTLLELKTPHQESIRKAVGDDYIDREKKFLEEFIDFLNPVNGNYIPVTTSEEREALMQKWNTTQRVILTASWMANGWPIVSYLSAWATDEQSAFYFPGYLAEWTLGHQLAGPVQMKQVTISGKSTNIKARMKNFTFLSWHADEEDLLVFLEAIKFRKNSKVLVVHGDILTSSASFKNTLIRNSYSAANVLVPDVNEEQIIRPGSTGPLLRKFHTQAMSILKKVDDSAGSTRIGKWDTLEILESELALITDAIENIDTDFAGKDETIKETHRKELEWQAVRIREKMAAIEQWEETMLNAGKQSTNTQKPGKVVAVKKKPTVPQTVISTQRGNITKPSNEKKENEEYKGVRISLMELMQQLHNNKDQLNAKMTHLAEEIYKQIHGWPIGELKKWLTISRHIKDLTSQLEGKKSQKSQKEARLERSIQARTELENTAVMNPRKRKRLETTASSDTNELEIQIELLEKDITRIEEEISNLLHTQNGIFSGIQSEEDVIHRCAHSKQKIKASQWTNENIYAIVERGIRQVIREAIHTNEKYKNALALKDRIQSEEGYIETLLELAESIAERDGDWDSINSRIKDRKKEEKMLTREIRQIDTQAIIQGVITKLAS